MTQDPHSNPAEPGSDPDRQSEVSAPKISAASRLAQLERRQGELWRMALFLLVLFAGVFAWTSWGTIRSLSGRFEALPIGLVVLVALFGFYAWRRAQEISELRGLLLGIEHRDKALPSEGQLDSLFEMISKSQQGYRDLIDSFDDVLLALSLDGEIRAGNRSFADLAGVSFSQLIGHPLSDFLDDPQGEMQKTALQALPRFLERRCWTGVVQFRLKGRPSVYYFDCVAHAMVRDAQVKGITILGRNVTAQRQSEARFTELFESLQEGIYFTTPEGRILDANPAMVRIFGYESKEALLRKNAADLYFDPAEREALKREIEETSRIAREIVLRKKDGTPVYCLNTATAVRDATGRIIRYQGSLMDITERREIEGRLHREQEFARRLVHNFPDPIFVLDTEGHYTFASPKAKEVMGYAPEEFAKLQVGSIAHPEDRPAVTRGYRELLAGVRAFDSLEYRIQTRQGDWRKVRANASPLYDEQGKIVGVVAAVRDVTNLKRLEEQLIQAEKLAAMGQMIAGVAHELNNPLTAILGVTELLRERAADEHTQRQVDLAHRQARRAAEIVQNLLDFSRPASPQKKLLSVNDLLERTLQLHEHSLRRNRIRVHFEPEKGLPNILGDANQLIQVFLNLLTNAEHAIREIRDAGNIQIRQEQVNGHVAVTVQDDGVGVRREVLPRLFDPFYTTKRPGGGTGLGLSICLAIIREHGGNIEAEPIAGGGSAFTVSLPVAADQGSAPASLDAVGQKANTSGRRLEALRGRSILVADDEEGIRDLVREGLTAQGLEVDCAATVDQALDLLRRRPYDAVLCDVHLDGPGKPPSGREILKRISAEPGAPTPAFIFMTGDLVDSAASAVPERGAGRIQKPFRLSELLAVLIEVLETAPAQTR